MRGVWINQRCASISYVAETSVFPVPEVLASGVLAGVGINSVSTLAINDRCLIAAASPPQPWNSR